MSETLCKINKKSDIEKVTLLYTNPDSNPSSFASSRWDFDKDPCEFDFIRIIWKDSNTSIDFNFADYPVDKNMSIHGSPLWVSHACLFSYGPAWRYALIIRILKEDNSYSGSIRFNDCYAGTTNSSLNNRINIPLAIYGVKRKPPKIKDPFIIDDALEEDESDATLD